MWNNPPRFYDPTLAMLGTSAELAAARAVESKGLKCGCPGFVCAGHDVEPDQHTLDLLRENIMRRIHEDNAKLSIPDLVMTAKHSDLVAFCLEHGYQPEQLAHAC